MFRMVLKRRAAPGRKAVIIFQPIMFGSAPGDRDR